MIIRDGKKGERGMEVGEEGKTGEAQSFILHRPLRRWRVERVQPYPRVYTAESAGSPLPRVNTAKSAGPPLPPEFTRRKVLVHPYPPSLHGEKCWSNCLIVGTDIIIKAYSCGVYLG